MAAFSGSQGAERGLVLGDVDPECKPVVIGIDFGTAYSGVAFAYRADPGSIQCGAPTAADPAQIKVPTALLQMEDGTWEFGNEAESKYNEILNEHNAIDPTQPAPAHLYKRFKMVLKGENKGFDTLTALSVNNKAHSLIELVEICLRKLKDYALGRVNGGFGGAVNPTTEVQWVLTVPAIWNDFGKAFMRKAAFRAGLMETELSDNLQLVLEPEGAALAVHVGASAHNLLGKSCRFMVLDCGGGTVDITVHEVICPMPLALKAVSIPSGGDWGGDYVNIEFKKFLKELLGPDLYNESELPFEFYNIMVEFDKVKIMFEPSKPPGFIRLLDVLENKRQLLGLANAYNLKHPDKPVLTTPTINNGFLPMSKELMLSFFEPFLAATVRETQRVLTAIPNITNVMVVGGFGSSRVLTSRIQAEFQGKNNVRVILPDTNPKPQGAIVQGAVYFGLYKNIIQSRVSPFTYGIAMQIDGVHNSFKVLVTKNQELSYDHEVTQTGMPASPEQTALNWRIFRSDLLAPPTVIGEHPLGKLEVKCPKHHDEDQRGQTGKFYFGGSEIRVEVENHRGETYRTEIAMT